MGVEEASKADLLLRILLERSTQPSCSESKATMRSLVMAVAKHQPPQEGMLLSSSLLSARCTRKKTFTGSYSVTISTHGPFRPFIASRINLAPSPSVDIIPLRARVLSKGQVGLTLLELQGSGERSVGLRGGMV